MSLITKYKGKGKYGPMLNSHPDTFSQTLKNENYIELLLDFEDSKTLRILNFSEF